MSAEALFSLASAVVLPGWLILLFGPRRWVALNSVPSLIIPLLLSALYTVLVLSHFAEAGGGYASLSDVRQLFTNDMVLLAGWTHYLAFDLFVGAWCAARMDQSGISRLVQGFVLPIIFLFGPAGFLLAYALIGGGQFSGKIPLLNGKQKV